MVRNVVICLLVIATVTVTLSTVVWIVTRNTVQAIRFSVDDLIALNDKEKHYSTTTAANSNENNRHRVNDGGVWRILPQNAWWHAYNDATKTFSVDDDDIGADDMILRANIIARTNDGLIIIRPLGMYVYYVRGDKFYYFSESADIGERRRCSIDTESAVFVLEPKDRFDNTDDSSSHLRSGCLSATLTELLSTFAGGSATRRRTISLDPLLLQVPRDQKGANDDDTTRTTAAPNDNSDNKITLIEMLNYLLDQRAL